MTLYFVRPEAREADYPRPHEVVSPPFVGRFGVLGCYLPDGLMPPEDAKRYLEEPHEGEEFYCCVAEMHPFVAVRNNAGREFRVSPERFIWVAAPRFQRGDQVVTKVGTRRTGWIASRGWHYKQRSVCYRIEIQAAHGRKRHSPRYWEHELELHTPTEIA